MKRIFAIICPLILITALVGYLFQLGDYNFFRQLTKIDMINFPNPFKQWETFNNKLTELKDMSINLDWSFPLFKDVHDITDFFSNVGSFFGYLGQWFNNVLVVLRNIFTGIWFFIQTICFFLFDGVVDLLLLCISFLIMLGFPVDYFFAI